MQRDLHSHTQTTTARVALVGDYNPDSIWGLAVDDADPIIAPLACLLDEQPSELQLEPGSRLAAIYQSATAREVYHCSYGLNPKHNWRFSQGALRVAARFEQAEIRAIELDDHPFYFATLFQPERSALTGVMHPLIRAFVRATLGSVFKIPTDRADFEDTP